MVGLVVGLGLRTGVYEMNMMNRSRFERTSSFSCHLFSSVVYGDYDIKREYHSKSYIWSIDSSVMIFVLSSDSVFRGCISASYLDRILCVFPLVRFFVRI